MPAETRTTTALDDQVLNALLGAKYLLVRLRGHRAQGRPMTEADVTDMTTLIAHLAEAADVFHAWWRAQQAPEGERRVDHHTNEEG